MAVLETNTVPPSEQGDRSQPDGLPSILFVDDEEGVLSGLRTSLRRLRRQYRMHFALGGHEALQMMATEPIDVVVTDMRMPAMNGVELLRRLKADYPHVVRYVLSGEADRSLVMQAIPITHRWLTKPCAQETLVEAISDAVSHHQVLGDQQVREVIGSIDALPVPPRLYSELVELLQDPESDIDQIVAAIAFDPAVAAKLLQWANSAFAGGAPVSDLKTAVVRLGLNMVSYLVLCAEIVHLLDVDDIIPGISSASLRRHVRSVSVLASSLAQPSETLLAGTAAGLAEIGLLIEATHMPERLHAAYRHAEANNMTLLEAESELYGVTHIQTGSHLLSVWGLPSQLVLAVEGSHLLPAPVPAPLRAAEAVRAAMLASQQLPYFEAFGQPYRQPITPELQVAVNGWLGALAIDADSPDAAPGAAPGVAQTVAPPTVAPPAAEVDLTVDGGSPGPEEPSGDAV